MLALLATVLAAMAGSAWALWKRRWMSAACCATYPVLVATLVFELLPPIAVPITFLVWAVANATTTRPFENVDDEMLFFPTPSWVVTVLSSWRRWAPTPLSIVDALSERARRTVAASTSPARP